jgi:hypothetical protein
MTLVQLALAIATGAVPLTASFYTYDKLAGSTSFTRSGLAALAGLGAGVVASLALVPLTGIVTEYPVMSLDSSKGVSGLADAWSLDMLPPRGGIPMNVYNRMPSVVTNNNAFGVN